ncbi:MAG: LON peptidase substrate-binding domain-containing protein [Acidobacteriota bacterium]
MAGKTVRGGSQCPMIPLRGAVAFPNLKFSCTIGRRPSMLALEKALSEDRILLLVAQHDETTETPAPEQVYKVGTLVFIAHHSYLTGNDFLLAQFEGIERARILSVEEVSGYWQATYRRISEPVAQSSRNKKLLDQLTSLIAEHFEKTESFFWSTYLLEDALWIDDPLLAASSISSYLKEAKDKQEILELSSVQKRLARLIEIISRKLESQERA